MTGNFSRGEVIRICNLEGRDIAHGVTRYNSDALRRIAGHHSQQIDTILGLRIRSGCCPSRRHDYPLRNRHMLEQMGIAAKAASYKLALLSSREKPRTGNDS